MKYRLFICLISLTLFGYSAKAQDSKLSLNLNYNYSFPASNFNTDLVKDASPRGFTGNLMYSVTPLISVGLGLGYQDYYQRYPREVYNYGKSQQISAVMTNSIQTVPVTGRVEINPLQKTQRSVNPYISLEVGADFISYAQYLGQFASTSSDIGFIARGGLGVKIPIVKNGSWGLDVGGNYDYAPYKKFGLKDLNSANAHAGVYFNVR